MKKNAFRETSLLALLITALVVGGCGRCGVRALDEVDVWCEGLPAERCAEHADLCQLGITCNGGKVCRRSFKEAGAARCGAKGEMGVACCRGLEARCSVITGKEGCGEEETDSPTCLACGDGVCDELENHCNCPEDCQPTPARAKIAFRGANPQGPSPRDPNVGPDVKTPHDCLRAGSRDSVLSCYRAWVISRFGNRTVQQLRTSTRIDPLTEEDLNIVSCLEEQRSGNLPLREIAKDLANCGLGADAGQETER